MNRFVPLLLLVPPLLACGRAAEEAPPAAAADPRPAQPTAASPWVPARPADELPLLQSPATAILPPEAAAALTPPFAARVEAVLVRPGDAVEAGAPLVRVVMPEVAEAAGRRAAARIRLETGRSRLAALAGLREAGMVRAAEIAAVEASIGEARAEILAAEAVLASAGLRGREAEILSRGGGVTLRSPVAGLVTEVDAPLGAIREPGDGPLVRIAGGSAERVVARMALVPPEGARAEFVGPEGDPVPLVRLAVSPIADPRDGSREVFFALPPGAQVAAGSAGVVRTRLPPEPGAVAVPARALLLREGRSFAFVRRNGAVEEVQVEVLATGRGDALIRGSILPGDEVAADAFSLVAGGVR